MSEDDRGPGGRIGIFRSWRALYASVFIYTLALIVILYLVTRLLDYSVP